ncbi:4-hydroxyphenylacetate 3-hydroxylase N-terminal domain-containing protein [Reyranella sp.]|uniref:4-hydroxyphenylacetate 3-hydroxylase N-terminal domain-containing protein n=1 Tax=Reyranella sp. TaxID=1929291 RepID=UPI0037841162
MAIKTGQEYVASLRDGRTLHIDGKVVSDVTDYLPLRGVIDTIAALHDDQHDPALGDILTYRSPSTGDLVSKTYLEARTAEEFRALAACFHLRAQRTFGLMGRLTDFMSGFLVDLSAGLRALGKNEAAARAQGMVELCREGDLQVTHALIDPQSDRSTLDAPSQAVRVVERTAEGTVVSGCRMLATLAPVANECYVGPYYPRKAGEENFALAFVIPMNAPGLSILARESFHHGQLRFDRPLSSRFDEGDAILMFDRVLVPHDRMIVDGDLAAYNGMINARPGYTGIQACTRSTMKLRFLAGMATTIARANGRDKTPRFQAAIGELIALISVAEGIRLGAMAESQRRVEAYAAGKLVVEGDGLGEAAAVGSASGGAINFFFPYANTKAADVLRLAAGSGVLAMTAGDYAHPDVGPLMDQWLIGPNIEARKRLELMKLAWDMTGTEFGSRAGLYERLYSGDPEANAQRWFRSPVTRECEGLVQRLLEG